MSCHELLVNLLTLRLVNTGHIGMIRQHILLVFVGVADVRQH